MDSGRPATLTSIMSEEAAAPARSQAIRLCHMK
jgi:hypothetical protein